MGGFERGKGNGEMMSSYHHLKEKNVQNTRMLVSASVTPVPGNSVLF